MHTLKSRTTLFKRRPDITDQDRALICYLTVYQNRRGLVPKLASKYNTSEQFIYKLRKEYKANIEKNNTAIQTLTKELNKEYSSKAILVLRMLGKCSIESISSVMEWFGLAYNSVGFISQTLKAVGKKIGNDLDKINAKEPLKYVFCSDEIFSNQTPILITVCPISFMILRIELAENRKGVTWKEHWESLVEQGYIPVLIVRDEGVGMISAQELLDFHVPSQSDTYHAIAHSLGVWRIRLEKRAHSAIKEEYRILRLLGKAKSDKVFDKRYIKYIDSQKKSHKACMLYDLFEFLYDCLLECFQIFDSSGKLKNQTQTIAVFECALELMESLNLKKVNEEIKSINNCKKDLFYFTQIAEKVVAQLSQTIDNKVLELLCLAYQTQKNRIKLKKKTKQRNALKRKEQHILGQAKELLGANYEAIKNEVYAKLEQIVQSSAAVECINSILRPYLNTCKNKPSQEFLNLFMFYHNHRRFAAGKRKGKTPFEIFSGEPQLENWLDLLLKKVAS